MKQLLVLFLLFGSPAFSQLRPVSGLSKWEKFSLREPVQKNMVVKPVMNPLTRYYGQAPVAFFCNLEAVTERRLGIQLLFHAGNYFHDSGFRYW